MKPPGLCWTDPTAVRGLLRRLQAPVGGTRPTTPPAAEPSPAPARSSEQQARSLTPFEPADGSSPFERLEALCRHVADGLSAESVFLADADGLLVTGVEPDHALVVAAAPFISAAVNLGRTSGRAVPEAGTLLLAGERHLHLVWVTVDGGHFCLGVVTASPLPPTTLRGIHRDLLVAFGKEAP